MRDLYSTLLLIFFSTCLFGQVAFQTNSVYKYDDFINSYYDVITADIDNDNDLDIIVTSAFSNNKLAWFENLDGMGNYAPSVIIAELEDETNIAVGDMDGDDDLDIIIGTGWYQNLDGQGTFSEVTIFSEDYTDSVGVVDFDGDGDLDVLTAYSWYKNTDGLGSLALEQTFVIESISEYSDRSVAGDIDGDGDMDVVTILRDTVDKVIWYENTNGLGLFGASQYINGLNNPSFVEVADLNGDNNLDIIIVNTGGFGNLQVFENLDGGQTWNSTTVYNNFSDNYRSLNVGDIDFDGDIDISFALDSNNFRWLRNNGSGSFQLRPTSSDASHFALNADVDGDNDLDVIVVNRGSLAWDTFPYESNPNRTYIEESLNVDDIFFADLDFDGDLDVVSTSVLSREGVNRSLIAWHENRDGYIAKVPLKRLLSAPYFSETQLVDIDNDNDLDLLGYVAQTNRVFVYENEDDTENFVNTDVLNVNYSIANFDFINAFTLVDVDLDGDKDIISYVGFDTVWFENNENDFDTSNLVVNTPYESVISADFDNDGDFDLLGAGINTLSWIENLDGNGTFGAENDLGAIETSKKILETIDLDNDSDLDIVCYNLESNKIVWLENSDGLGAFNPAQVLVANTPSPTTLRFADINNDGAMDIVCSYDLGLNWSDNVVWFENLDNQNFAELQLIAEEESEKIELGDYDNDGDIDIVSASEDGILIYKNVGNLGNTINGVVSFDTALNGCATDAIPVKDLLVVSDNGTDSFGSFSANDGSYIINVNQGLFSTSAIYNLPSYFTVNPNSSESDFSTLGNTDIANFCLQATQSINDLNIVIFPSINDPRPGFNTTYQLVYTNIGTTQLSGSISFEFDDLKLNFLNASETIAAQTANTLTFDFTDLNPFETRTINLEFNVFAPPTTNIDDELIATATINPVLGDETEEDNVFTLEQTVIGSYDPNDIAVLEGDEITINEAEKYLHYLIRFQNTGTASAINVSVDHVLDNKLDWTTMQLVSLSHAGRVEIANETDVSFIFNNINLVDSTSDEPNSHGYIAFKIKPKSDVDVGDVFSGVAAIYFDFNPPIITNTVTTEIVAPLSVADFNKQSIQLFPNPAKSKLKITSNRTIDQLTIIDINGRVLNEIKLSNSEYNLDVSNLTKGVYFLEIRSGALKSTRKIIKN